MKVFGLKQFPNYGMIKNYLPVLWRHLTEEDGYEGKGGGGGVGKGEMGKRERGRERWGSERVKVEREKGEEEGWDRKGREGKKARGGNQKKEVREAKRLEAWRTKIYPSPPTSSCKGQKGIAQKGLISFRATFPNSRWPPIDIFNEWLIPSLRPRRHDFNGEFTDFATFSLQ